MTTKKYLNFKNILRQMRDSANYGGANRNRNKETNRTYGARFIGWNSALNALIEGCSPDKPDEELIKQKAFEQEIDSQKGAYGKKETIKVIDFLITTIQNETAPERILNTNFREEQKINTNFTEEQKEFFKRLSSDNSAYGAVLGNLIDTRCKYTE